MKRTAVILLILTAFTAAAAPGAEVTGKWTGGGKGVTLTFTFTQDGPKLAGTVQTSTGETVAISDGRIEGDKLSFTVYLDEDRSLKLVTTGIVNGGEIELNAKAEGVGFSGGGPLTLKRGR
ncbi:MAG: hypothetical protein LAQ30_28925 [Acidobacteriia bacterium]|nr:hypothetical protein [Terriglobia bacterium]